MIATAFLLGLGGGLHCVGMCGPIAMALPLSTKTRWMLLRQSLLYHFGRITTYSILGLLFGSLGWGAALIGYQNGLSIILGGTLILMAIFSFVKVAFWAPTKLLFWVEKLKRQLAQLLQIKRMDTAFFIGLLNGLLPCGLVYMALAGALSMGHYWQGMLFMFTFGLGTLPLLLGVMMVGQLSLRGKRFLRSFSPYLLFGFGLFLIYRGLQIELPAELTFWEAIRFGIRCH